MSDSGCPFCVELTSVAYDSWTFEQISRMSPSAVAFDIENYNANGFDGNNVPGVAQTDRAHVQHFMLRITNASSGLVPAVPPAAEQAYLNAGSILRDYTGHTCGKADGSPDTPYWLFLGSVGGFSGYEVDGAGAAITTQPIFELTLSFAYMGDREFVIPGLAANVTIEGWQRLEPVYAIKYDTTNHLRYPSAVAFNTYTIFPSGGASLRAALHAAPFQITSGAVTKTIKDYLDDNNPL